MNVYNYCSYVDNSNVSYINKSSSKNIYYILPTKNENSVTWEADLRDQSFSFIPSVNSLYLKMDLTIHTDNYLPNECYLFDIIFGNIEINNVNLNWLSTNQSESIVKFGYDRTIMIDNEQLNEFTNQKNVPLQIRFKLNKQPLEGINLDQNDINQLDVKMRSCNNLNFNLDYTNFSNETDQSNFVSLIYGYTYNHEKMTTLNKKYFYKCSFPSSINTFASINQIMEFREIGQVNDFDMNEAAVQFDFFYHDNNFEPNKEQHFNITQKRLAQKNWQDYLLYLPDKLIYQNDSKYDKSSDGSGFFLPYGGYGNLTVTIDFFVNQLPRKIVFTWPFTFASTFDCIQANITSTSIKSLTGFSSFEEKVNDA